MSTKKWTQLRKIFNLLANNNKRSLELDGLKAESMISLLGHQV